MKHFALLILILTLFTQSNAQSSTGGEKKTTVSKTAIDNNKKRIRDSIEKRKFLEELNMENIEPENGPEKKAPETKYTYYIVLKAFPGLAYANKYVQQMTGLGYKDLKVYRDPKKGQYMVYNITTDNKKNSKYLWEKAKTIERDAFVFEEEVKPF